jgi:hypothetical protein
MMMMMMMIDRWHWPRQLPRAQHEDMHIVTTAHQRLQQHEGLLECVHTSPSDAHCCM